MSYSVNLVQFSSSPNSAIVGPSGSLYGFPPESGNPNASTFRYLLASHWVCLPNDGQGRTATIYCGDTLINIFDTGPATGVRVDIQSGFAPPWWSAEYSYNWNGFVTNVLVSIDSNPAAPIIQVYANDVALSVASGGLTGQPLGEFACSIAALTFQVYAAAPSALGAGVGDVFIAAPINFYDLSVTNNRRAFINADLTPVDPGPNGTGPLSTQPQIYLTARDGVPNDMANNNGIGGAMTVQNGPLIFESDTACTVHTSQTTIIGPPPGYLHFLTCCDRAIMAHLYQITTVTGISDYFTDFDIDIFYNNITWKSSGLRFEGLHRKVGIGVSVDEQSLKIWASPTDTMFGATFLTGAEEGLLDGATIVRTRIIWQFLTGNVAYDITQPPLYAWTLFTGYMSAIEKGGVSHVEFKVKSALLKLNINMPRNYYQPGCLWTLYDSGCTLIKANFAYNATVASAGPTTVTTNPSIASLVNPTGADGNPYFAQGRLLFNSGDNEGLQVLIDTNDSGNLYLAYPLNTIPNPGDSITFYPGCSKTFTTCGSKFNNTANFRGFDKVPPVFISI